MKSKKLLAIAGLMLALASACEKATLPTEDREAPRYYEFKFFLDHVLEVYTDSLTLYTDRGDCIRPIMDGDGIRVPKDVTIEEFEDHAMISGIGRANKVLRPWLIIKCD